MKLNCMVIEVITIILGFFTVGSPLFGQARAFVWNDRATGSGYTNGYYQFNSASGANFVTNLATGKYRIDLPGLGVPGGVVHVTAYGGNHYCKPERWSPSGTTMQVFVDCFAPSGLPVNGFFSLLFYTESSTVTSSDEAYLWADNATATTYTPNLAYQWNSKKLTNTMQHVGTGSYQATLSGLTTTGGTVLATGYGSGPERCKVAQWYHATSGLAVNVACFHADGSPADTQFTLSFMSNVLIGGASAWADQPYAQSYTPSQTYQYSSTGSTVTIGRTSLGTYNVSLPSQPPYNKTAAFVTAYGTTPDYCNVGSWVPSNSNQYDTVININCYDRSGSPTDSFYTVQYMTDRPPYLFAKTDISCGSRTVTVSTGNGAGTCTKNTTNGKDDSATCNDGAGNWAVANCSDNNGSGGCRGSSGSGECGIHN